jgi:hypothetical protein
LCFSIVLSSQSKYTLGALKFSSNDVTTQTDGPFLEFRRGEESTESRGIFLPQLIDTSGKQWTLIASQPIARGRPIRISREQIDQCPSSAKARSHKTKKPLSVYSRQPADPVGADLSQLTFVQSRSEAGPRSSAQASRANSLHVPPGADDNLILDLSSNSDLRDLDPPSPRAPYRKLNQKSMKCLLCHGIWTDANGQWLLPSPKV